MLFTTPYVLLTTHYAVLTTQDSLRTTHNALLRTHDSLLTTDYSPKSLNRLFNDVDPVLGLSWAILGQRAAILSQLPNRLLTKTVRNQYSVLTTHYSLIVRPTQKEL